MFFSSTLHFIFFVDFCCNEVVLCLEVYLHVFMLFVLNEMKANFNEMILCWS